MNIAWNLFRAVCFAIGMRLFIDYTGWTAAIGITMAWQAVQSAQSKTLACRPQCSDGTL
jgi:hypothetical protein